MYRQKSNALNGFSGMESNETELDTPFQYETSEMNPQNKTECNY